MKKIIPLLLMLVLILCACGGQESAAPTTTEPTTVPTEPTVVTTGTEPSEPETTPSESTTPSEVTDPSETTESSESTEPSETEPTVPQATMPDVYEPETTEATEPKPTEPKPTEPQPTEPQYSDYTNPLTGEYISKPYKNRPYMVVIDNDNKQAQPHWGVGEADILWELPHEFNTSRLVAMYMNIDGIPRFGPTRSARPYQLSLTMGYDGIFIHAGHSPQAREELANTGWDHLDGVHADYSYYYRDKYRLENGIDSWHTMFTTSENVLKAIKDKGITASRGEVVDYGMQFAKDGTPDGKAADYIDIRFTKGGRRSELWYDADLGKYMKQQFAQVYTDANTGKAVTFENVLILEADVSVLPGYGYLAVDLIGSGEGYFACGGEYVSIRWSRSDTSSPFTFTLADGSPLTFGVGNTYAAVVKTGAPVSFA